MKKLLLTFVALSALGCVSTASAAPSPQFGADALNHVSSVEKAQFVFGGRNYCFYLNGWHGPGWYWCGYSWRRGYGWGGGRGWHGWHEGGRRGGVVFRGGRGYRGGYGHGGGGHGGGHPHIGGHGGHGGGHGGGHHH
jgi:hypothetical protein